MIDILLATYNGENYLREQLDSIVGQSFKNWRVIVRDDISMDRTSYILQDYHQRYPDQFIIISDKQENIGILQNFSLLMQYSTASYMVFCDQDDIWLPEKLLISLNVMKEAELNNSQLPILVHSDLTVVDSRLNIVDKSFWHYQNLNPKLDSFNRLLIQNTVTGCTAMINRKLLTIILPIPQQAIMHDWWIALVASMFGKIIIVNQPTVLYRQHGNNDTGAKEWSFVYIVKKAFTILNRIDLLRTIKLTQQQAKVFYNQFSIQLTGNQKDMITGYIGLNNKNKLYKVLFLFKHRLLKQGAIRNIALFLRI